MQLIKDFLSKHSIQTKTLAIGVSGGADSLALALLMKDELPDYHLIALTVDHGLRPTSRQEAEYVAKVMAQFGIEHHILTWVGEKPVTGIEEQARIARYDLLCSWCKAHQIEYLVIAHHLFDQAETFLMRLERGSGLFGLSAIKDISERDSIKILRPLLNIHPDRLKEYLKEKNIAWVEDESNQCEDFLRVKMRKFLPILEEKTGISAERLCLAAENLQQTRAFIEDVVQNTINEKVHLWGISGASFDYAAFMTWHDELKFYILSKLITDISGNAYMPEANQLRTVIKDLMSDNFTGITLGGVFILKQDLRLWLIKENRNIEMNYQEDEWLAYEKNVPEVRGIKIPAKLKQALIYEKKHEK